MIIVMHRRTTNVITSGVCHKPDVSVEGNSQLHLTCFKIQETSTKFQYGNYSLYRKRFTYPTQHRLLSQIIRSAVLHKFKSPNVLTDPPWIL